MKVAFVALMVAVAVYLVIATAVRARWKHDDDAPRWLLNAVIGYGLLLVAIVGAAMAVAIGVMLTQSFENLT